jgi:predicted aspartyl protease
MKISFSLDAGLILVPALIVGPKGDSALRMAIDTGATFSLVNKEILADLGFDPDECTDMYRVTTGNGTGEMLRIITQSVESVGIRRLRFPVLCHSLPPGTGIDGLLGIDFFEGTRLHIDFIDNIISVTK